LLNLKRCSWQEPYNQTEFENILTVPIYLSFTKDKINKVVTFNLSDYSVILKGNYLITLEQYKDLGEGSLQYWSDPSKVLTFFRKTCEGKWHNSPGSIGMFVHCQLVK